MPLPNCNGDDHAATGDAAQSGFIIIAVLWILAALATLVISYSLFVTNTAYAVSSATDRVQNEAALKAIIEMTCFRILSGNAPRSGEGRVNLQIGQASVDATFVSEAARIDLNLAAKDLLAGLMSALGESPANADAYARRIVAWRSPAGSTGADDDPENILYRSAGIGYLPRHAPFPHADELWQVYGIPKFLVERMMPYVTVYSGRAAVNLGEASPLVIAAVPGMSPDRLDTVLGGRPVPPGAGGGRPPANVGGESVMSEKSRAMRILAQMTFRDGRRVNSEAVIFLRDDAGEPYRVLNVRENLDDGAAMSQIERLR